MPSRADARRAVALIASMWDGGLLGTDPETREAIRDLIAFVEASPETRTGERVDEIAPGRPDATRATWDAPEDDDGLIQSRKL